MSGAENHAALRLERVRIALRGNELLAIDETIRPGQVLTVMGPSGSGKSSLLAYAAGFLDDAFEAEGRICLGEMELTGLPAAERRLGLMFQDALLFPHMSVGQNLAFALSPQVKGVSARRQAVEAALGEAGLDGMADRDPATLSGGQASRVALMRVLLSQPRALLLDEPFSRLDTDLRKQIRSFVFGEARKRDLPVLLVTHDSDDATAAGGLIVELT